MREEPNILMVKALLGKRLVNKILQITKPHGKIFLIVFPDASLCSLGITGWFRINSKPFGLQDINERFLRHTTPKLFKYPSTPRRKSK
jgi:hypothetical protein